MNAEVDVFPAVVGLLVTNNYYAHYQELFRTAVAASGFRINAEVDVFPAVVDQGVPKPSGESCGSSGAYLVSFLLSNHYLLLTL
jgi:hypothetical protein